MINKISELVILGLNKHQTFRNKNKIVNKFRKPVLLFLTVEGKTIKTGKDSDYCFGESVSRRKNSKSELLNKLFIIDQN